MQIPIMSGNQAIVPDKQCERGAILVEIPMQGGYNPYEIFAGYQMVPGVFENKIVVVFSEVPAYVHIHILWLIHYISRYGRGLGHYKRMCTQQVYLNRGNNRCHTKQDKQSAPVDK
jgi:hypothetical protein